MIFFANEPPTLHDASTQISRFAAVEDWVQSRWTYYYNAVQHYLRRQGVPADRLPDLTSDFLVKLERVMQTYDRSRGPFRPYLCTAIRNFHIDQCRRREPEQLGDSSWMHLAFSLSEQREEKELHDAALLHFVRMAFYYFEVDADQDPQDRRGHARALAILHAQLVERLPQAEIASRFRISVRQVRSDTAKAAKALCDWIARWVTPEDIDDLVDLARRREIPFSFSLAELDGLFKHLSKRKIDTIHLLLAVISQKPRAQPAQRVADGGDSYAAGPDAGPQRPTAPERRSAQPPDAPMTTGIAMGGGR